MGQCTKMLWNSDEIQIMKPSPPLGILMYVDFHYETLLEIRKKKIDKILNKIDKKDE